MRANGSKRGARDGRSSFGRSGRRIRSFVRAAAGQCGSSRLSPNKALSTRYSGTSGSSTPTRRLRAIILRPSSAGRLSGEPGTPHTWPHFPAPRWAKPDRAGRPPRIPSPLVRSETDDFSVEPVGGSMTPDRRRSGDTPQGPHERNCVDLTPSGRRIARARILTRNRISYRIYPKIPFIPSVITSNGTTSILL